MERVAPLRCVLLQGLLAAIPSGVGLSIEIPGRIVFPEQEVSRRRRTPHGRKGKSPRAPRELFSINRVKLRLRDFIFLSFA